MVGHGAKFIPKMEQAIAALLTHKSIEDAARAVGIGVNTLQRWMRKPEFEATLREARQSVLACAIGRLQAASGAAATTLLKIMLDANGPAGIRLRAAESVLEHAAKARAFEDLEDRVAKLERKASLKKSSHQPPAITLLTATSLLGPFPMEIQAAPPLDGKVADDDPEK